MTVKEVIAELSKIKPQDAREQACAIVSGGEGIVQEVSWIDTAEATLIFFYTDGRFEKEKEK